MSGDALHFILYEIKATEWSEVCDFSSKREYFHFPISVYSLLPCNPSRFFLCVCEKWNFSYFEQRKMALWKQRDNMKEITRDVEETGMRKNQKFRKLELHPSKAICGITKLLFLNWYHVPIIFVSFYLCMVHVTKDFRYRDLILINSKNISLKYFYSTS